MICWCGVSEELKSALCSRQGTSFSKMTLFMMKLWVLLVDGHC
jgi:hypothetical protein